MAEPTLIFLIGIVIIIAIALAVSFALKKKDKADHATLMKKILASNTTTPAHLTSSQNAALQKGVSQGTIPPMTTTTHSSPPSTPPKTDDLVNFLDKHKALLIALPVQVIAAIVLKKVIERITGRVEAGIVTYTAKVAARILEKMGVQLGEKTLTRLGIRAAERLATTAATTVATDTAIAAASGPGFPFVEAALLAFDALTIGLDAGDAAGYGKMSSNSEYATMKKGIDSEVEDAYKQAGAKLPIISGPFDNLSKDQLVAAIVLETTTLVSSPNNPYMATFKTALANYLKEYPKATSSDIDAFTKANMNLVDTDQAQIDATNKVCTNSGGTMTSNQECSWSTQEKCDSSYPWPPPQDKSNYHYSEWRPKDGTCQVASYALRGICESLNLDYDKTTGICTVNEDYCKRKGAKWENNDCVIPLGQSVAEAIFGTTIVRGLEQVFDPAQYKPCHANETDDGYFCRQVGCDNATQDTQAGLCYSPKCKAGESRVLDRCYTNCPPGSTDDGLTCRTISCPDGQYESGGLCYTPCKDGYTKSGLICYQNCRDGYNSTLGLCTRPLQSYDRGAGRIPDKRACASGLRDDGTSCWEDLHCNTSCPGGGPWYNIANCHTDCSGGVIRQTLSDRQYCRDDEEMKDGLCYKKCADGYTGGLSTCTKFADSYIPDSYGGGVGTPAVHITSKDSYSTGLGKPAVHVRAKERAVPYSTKDN